MNVCRKNTQQRYPLLSDDAVVKSSSVLSRHRFFYHFTLDDNLPSIRKHGLSPSFEGPDSSYGQRTFEPEKALRYCLEHELATGLSAARSRARVWDDATGHWVERPEKIVLLRMPSSVLLHRAYGLDHSHGGVMGSVNALALVPGQTLTADQFVRIVEAEGVISCYDIIPAADLQLCSTPIPYVEARVGDFVRLLGSP